jgi:hypothetical protein
MRLKTWTAMITLLLAGTCSAATLTPTARQEFDNYVTALEKRLSQQHASSDTYLAVLNLETSRRSDAMRQTRAGEIRVDPVNGGTRELAGALLHHWRGTAFVPGAQAKDMLTLLRDYDHLTSYYAPEVQSSRLVSGNTEVTTVAMRMRKQKVVTVVLDAEYDVHTGMSSATAGYGFSRSIHVWQVANPSTHGERRLPEGKDDGFLWRLNSYWSFLEVPGGLLIECEAVSLTRDIPIGLNWLIAPILESTPRESLTFTLIATRNALKYLHQKGSSSESGTRITSEGNNARR